MIAADSASIGQWRLQPRFTQNYAGVQLVYERASTRPVDAIISAATMTRAQPSSAPSSARSENELTAAVNNTLAVVFAGSVRCCDEPDLPSMRQCSSCDKWWHVKCVNNRGRRIQQGTHRVGVDWDCPDCVPTTTTTTYSQSQASQQSSQPTRSSGRVGRKNYNNNDNDEDVDEK